MGLTSAMYTALTGLNVNQSRIETIGNNIANVNTTAFKGSRTMFQTQFSNTLSAGTAPGDETGGTNPTQYGLGASVAATQKMFTPGSIETTGIASDVAIEGAGFFVVREGNGRQLYTRDGSFAVNSANQLVTVDGKFVRGFAVDQNFNIIPSVLSDLTIPLGTLTVARATSNVALDGDLSAAGTIATAGSVTTTQALVDGNGASATGGTALTDLRAASAPGVALFSAGNSLTVSGATKGGREIPPATFVVGTTGNTLDDFARWLQSTLGIQTGGGVPGNPGVTIQNGALVVTGNAGEPNAIGITQSNILSDNAGTPLPFQFTDVSPAVGSGVYTAFTVYDSLGTPVMVQATFTLESTPNTGPVWRYYLESPDGSGASRAIGTGTASFDNFGNLVSASGNQFTIDRSGTGAATPINFTLELSSLNGLSTQTSNVILGQQDGYPPGTLSNYSVQADGTIVGTFTNGLSRTLGQLALATFANEQGLVSEADDTYSVGPNAGEPAIVAPGEFGAGKVLGGALELSNVDLSREFIGLITSSTGFQASSRVISVSNDLLDALLLVVR
jgi:flagellar hook protein FlgE